MRHDVPAHDMQALRSGIQLGISVTAVFCNQRRCVAIGNERCSGTTGLHTMCGRLGLEQLRNMPLPCILHWNQNHFVVLYRISKNGKKFYIADPGKGL